MPAFSHWFGLKPPDFDDMTLGEFEEYAAELEKIDAWLKKQNR